MIEKDEITSNAKEVSEKLNNYFVDVIENLDITPFIEETEAQTHLCDPIENIVKKCSNHSSITKIKEHVTIETFFPSQPLLISNFKII